VTLVYSRNGQVIRQVNGERSAKKAKLEPNNQTDYEKTSLKYVCESGDSFSGKIVVNSDVKSTHEKVKQDLSLVVGNDNSYNVGRVAIALWDQHGNRSDHEDCHNGCGNAITTMANVTIVQ
jgi:hypothetical protein